MSRVEQAVKICGICKSTTEDLLGPYCGGPFVWYCKRCRRTIDTFLDGQERHRKFIKSLREKRKK